MLDGSATAASDLPRVWQCICYQGAAPVEVVPHLRHVWRCELRAPFEQVEHQFLARDV